MAEAKLAPNLPGWMLEHTNRYLSSGGTDGHMYTVTPPGYSEMIVPSLLLTTTGRKSGEKFIFPLYYGTDGDTYFVVASKGGAPADPSWFQNLTAEPNAAIQVLDEEIPVRASVAEGTERERLWSLMTEVWPAYDEYQQRTTRQIPVVIFKPA